jgi:hypothetical protein
MTLGKNYRRVSKRKVSRRNSRRTSRRTSRRRVSKRKVSRRRVSRRKVSRRRNSRRKVSRSRKTIQTGGGKCVICDGNIGLLKKTNYIQDNSQTRKTLPIVAKNRIGPPSGKNISVCGNCYPIIESLLSVAPPTGGAMPAAGSGGGAVAGGGGGGGVPAQQMQPQGGSMPYIVPGATPMVDQSGVEEKEKIRELLNAAHSSYDLKYLTEPLKQAGFTTFYSIAFNIPGVLEQVPMPIQDQENLKDSLNHQQYWESEGYYNSRMSITVNDIRDSVSLAHVAGVAHQPIQVVSVDHA